MYHPDPHIPHGIVRLAVLLCMAVTSAVGLRAQQDPAFQQYWQIETQFNPAAAGRLPQLQVRGAYQQHASGFDDAGSTMFAGADMAFRIGHTLHGVGAVFQSDQIGLFAHQRFSVQYRNTFRKL